MDRNMRAFVFIFSIILLMVSPAYTASNFSAMLQKAENGSMEAQLNIAAAYQYGRGVNKDYQKAFFWYEKAAQQGAAKAQRPLGALYEMGLGVDKDFGQAAFWYEKAAQQGVARAQVNLGILYENGQGVGQNYQTALSWYQKAAAKGYGRGMNHLGMLYEKGLGVKKDVKQALQFYKQGADAKYSRSMLNLGRIYEHGAEGVEKNLQQAAAWYERAIQIGYGEANVDLQRVEALLAVMPERPALPPAMQVKGEKVVQTSEESGLSTDSEGEDSKDSEAKAEPEALKELQAAKSPQEEKMAVEIDTVDNRVVREQSSAKDLDSKLIASESITEENYQKSLPEESHESLVSDQKIQPATPLETKAAAKPIEEDRGANSLLWAAFIVLANLFIAILFWLYMIKKRARPKRRSPPDLEDIGRDIREIRRQVNELRGHMK